MNTPNDTSSLWIQARREAITTMQAEPTLTPLMLSAIIDRASLSSALAHRLSHRIAGADISAEPLTQLFERMLGKHPEISHALPIDLQAILQRDPAIQQVSEVLLYLKGFHALCLHRFAHALWHEKRHQLARYLQSRGSEVFQTDIHPAAHIGTGVFIDHATGVVVGETSVINDNVTLLQGVTLGGTGHEDGDRHPKIRQGVLIGAGAKVLGNIEIGEFSRIGAGAVVVRDIPSHSTAVGVPARVIPHHGDNKLSDTSIPEAGCSGR